MVRSQLQTGVVTCEKPSNRDPEERVTNSDFQAGCGKEVAFRLNLLGRVKGVPTRGMESTSIQQGRARSELALRSREEAAEARQ